MMSIMHKYLVPSEDVICKEIDAKSVLLNLDNGTYYSLNKTGTYVFALADGTRTVTEIAAQVARYYGIHPELARKDVLDLVREMAQEAIIRLNDAPA